MADGREDVKPAARNRLEGMKSELVSRAAYWEERCLAGQQAKTLRHSVPWDTLAE